MKELRRKMIHFFFLPDCYLPRSSEARFLRMKLLLPVDFFFSFVDKRRAVSFEFHLFIVQFIFI